MGKNDSDEQTQKLLEIFKERNTASVFAKMILSNSLFRLSQVRKVELVSQNGTEMVFDCRDSKVFKKFMKKLKETK